MLLVGTSTLLSMLGIGLGIHAGWRRRSRFDTGATSFSMFTYSMPDFWIGMLFLLGCSPIQLDLFPTGGLEDPPAARPPASRRCSTSCTTWLLPCAWCWRSRTSVST
jgi:ABC-type dipeptide/oligopeptide/nickel transport system permease component